MEDATFDGAGPAAEHFGDVDVGLVDAERGIAGEAIVDNAGDDRAFAFDCGLGFDQGTDSDDLVRRSACGPRGRSPFGFPYLSELVNHRFYDLFRIGLLRKAVSARIHI